MNHEYDQVREFHQRFLNPVSDAPTRIAAKRAQQRAAFMREEIDEFLEAETIADQADAMIDLIYFALGTMVEMGVKPDALFAIVHEANMQKLWPDGKPHYNELNKVIKPDTWRDPGPLIDAAITAMGGEGA